MWTRRQLMDGIRWRTRTGAPWRDVPERYGPWDQAYDLFRRWQHGGIWKRIFEQLQAEADAKGLITWDVSVDSTIARTHQHAAGARKKGHCRRRLPAAYTEPDDHGLGRSRGGLTTKLHLAVEQGWSRPSTSGCDEDDQLADRSRSYRLTQVRGPSSCRCPGAPPTATSPRCTNPRAS